MGAPKGSANAVVHGGEHAVKAGQHGSPFRGLAAQEEKRVQADLQDQGRSELVIELATRLHTASRLYWNAIQMAADRAQEDDKVLKQLDGYVARFGWLAGAALRAWREVRAEEKTQSPTLDYDELVKELQNTGGSNEKAG